MQMMAMYSAVDPMSIARIGILCSAFYSIVTWLGQSTSRSCPSGALMQRGVSAPTTSHVPSHLDGGARPDA